MIPQHRCHGICLNWRRAGLINIFLPFDLEMKSSYIPILKIVGHVIKHGKKIEPNMSKLKQQSFRFGGKSVRHLK